MRCTAVESPRLGTGPGSVLQAGGRRRADGKWGLRPGMHGSSRRSGRQEASATALAPSPAVRPSAESRSSSPSEAPEGIVLLLARLPPAVEGSACLWWRDLEGKQVVVSTRQGGKRV